MLLPVPERSSKSKYRTPLKEYESIK